MRTIPSAEELIGIVAEALRGGDLARSPFYTVVAANALDIARREIAQGPVLDAAIAARLQPLLGRTGSAEELEQHLAREIAEGRVTLQTPGLADHLWQTVMAEMAIDQPKYATYRRCLAAAGAGEPT